MQICRFIKFRKFLIAFAGFTLLFISNISIYAQSNVETFSTCELLRNKKKLKGKQILVEGVLEIAPETSTFSVEDECSTFELIAVGEDKSFRPNETFDKATDLMTLEREAGKKLGVSLFWSVFLRVKIKAKGILFTSNKPKFGHLNTSKNLFLITEIKEIGQTQVLTIGDSKIIMTRDN